MSPSEKQTLGARLKARRLELGISLNEIAAETKVKTSYLKALEEDRFDVFPGETYLLGFLRGFASALDLDTGEIVKQYREQVAPVKAREEQPLPSQPVPEKEVEPSEGQPVNFKLAALLVVGIGALAVFLFWFLLSGPDLQEDRLEPPAEEKKPSVEEIVVPPVLPEPSQAKEDEILEGVEAEPVEVDKVEAEPIPPFQVTQAVPAEDLEKDIIQIPPAGGLIKLEALGPGKVEISIDRLSPRRYDLKAGIVLSWKVRRSARVHVEDPSMVKVWFDEELLDFSKRSELIFKSSAVD